MEDHKVKLVCEGWTCPAKLSPSPGCNGWLSTPPSVLNKNSSLCRGSLHYGQVSERVGPAPLGFIPGPEELDLPLLGFYFVLVLLEFLLGGHFWVGHRLGG